MGNVPGESGTTNFAHAYFPIESPVDVRAADRIAIRLDTHDGTAARWQVEVTRDGRSVARFDHSTLHAKAPSMHSLRKQADDYRPTLTPLGALERDLLDSIRRHALGCGTRVVAGDQIPIGAAVSAGDGRVPQADDRTLRLN